MIHAVHGGPATTDESGKRAQGTVRHSGKGPAPNFGRATRAPGKDAASTRTAPPSWPITRTAPTSHHFHDARMAGHGPGNFGGQRQSPCCGGSRPRPPTSTHRRCRRDRPLRSRPPRGDAATRRRGDVARAAVRETRDMHSVTIRRGIRSFVAFRGSRAHGVTNPGGRSRFVTFCMFLGHCANHAGCVGGGVLRRVGRSAPTTTAGRPRPVVGATVGARRRGT